ncbi:MAG: hypothetical protein H7Y39_01880 [Nitrospiraceae bacterium]|nr:hypothetical protein [Nitrospiraceae bacterium]
MAESVVRAAVQDSGVSVQGGKVQKKAQIHAVQQQAIHLWQVEYLEKGYRQSLGRHGTARASRLKSAVFRLSSHNGDMAKKFGRSSKALHT